MNPKASASQSHDANGATTAEVSVSTTREKKGSRWSGKNLPPIVVDLGRVRSKRIRSLKRGEGQLMQEVAEAMETVRGNIGAELEGKTLVPVVIVYERKARRRAGLLPFFF